MVDKLRVVFFFIVLIALPSFTYAVTDLSNCYDFYHLINASPSGYFRLVSNIDCSNTTNWNPVSGTCYLYNGNGTKCLETAGCMWGYPSGHYTAPECGADGGWDVIKVFNGTLDGQGYVVSGIYQLHQARKGGIFGNITWYGAIIDIGFTEVNLTGYSWPISVGCGPQSCGGSGALAEYNFGYINNTYLTGKLEVYCPFVYSGSCSVSRGSGFVYLNYGWINNSYTSVDVSPISFSGSCSCATTYLDGFAVTKNNISRSFYTGYGTGYFDNNSLLNTTTYVEGDYFNDTEAFPLFMWDFENMWMTLCQSTPEFILRGLDDNCPRDELYGDYEDYFDLWDLYAFELTGTVWLALIVGLFITFYFCSKINLPFQMTLLISTLWLSVVAAITLHIFIWALVVLEVGVLYYWIVTSKLRRG